ncbi:MAG TPA: hypothetical protein VGK74_13420 [Symbiobacteriaceae bacterium]|jgi:hypothetical protein
MRKLLQAVVALVLLQVVMGGITFLAADYRPVAVLVGLGFLALVWVAGRGFGRDADPGPGRTAQHGPGRTAAQALLAGLLWQLPGLQGSIRFATDQVGWTAYDGITDLQDFLMETWHTVLMPLLGVLPAGQVAHYYARYYILLVAVSPFLVLLFACAALSGAVRGRGRQATAPSAGPRRSV